MRKSVFRRNNPGDSSAVQSEAVDEAVGAVQGSEGEEEIDSAEGEFVADDLQSETAVFVDDEQDLSRSSEELGSSSSAVDAEHISRLSREVKENYDKYLRAVADLENYKKRALRERSDILRYAGENMARDLLEIADNFQLAFAQDLSAVPPEFVDGFRMISDRFMGILARYDVKAESAMGGVFDPAKQQALASVPTGAHPPGTIIEEYKSAYFFKDKLLRPGQVVVAVAPPQPASESEE